MADSTAVKLYEKEGGRLFATNEVMRLIGCMRDDFGITQLILTFETMATVRAALAGQRVKPVYALAIPAVLPLDPVELEVMDEKPG